MDKPESLTQRMTAVEARERWDELLHIVADGGTSVMVENDRAAAVAIISATDFEWFNRLVARRDQRFQELGNSWAAFKGALPEDVEQQVAAAVAWARKQIRQEKHQATHA